MEKHTAAPKTLVESIRYFSNPDTCQDFLVGLRWPDGATCPICGSAEVTYLADYRRWKCHTNHPRRQFSVKIGTIFEDSPIGLDKWLPAIWMIVNAKNGISSYEVARALGVTQKTAWFMMHRIRLSMQRGGFDKFSGNVEVDETFIGGRARFMHKSRKDQKIKGTGPMGKAAVMGLLERHGTDKKSRVRLMVVKTTRRHLLQASIRAHVKPGANLYTDELKSYEGLGQDGYIHQVINHAEAYAKGNVHTNGLENFWSLLKRALKGTYVSVEPFHLFRYLDEQAFRFNKRAMNDAGRFVEALGTIIGRRLTYKDLIGDAGLATPA